MLRMMKKRFYVIGTLLALFVCGSALATPKMVVDDTLFQFGYVPQNSKATHDFWIYSRGDAPLDILNVIPGCGCTKTPIEKTHLAPGDSTRLEVIFDTRNYSGTVIKQPMIATNEGVGNRYLHFEANVAIRPDSTYPVILSPYKLEFPTEPGKKVDGMKFTITNVSDKPLDLSLVSWPRGMVTVDLPRSVGAKKSVQASVKLTEAAAGQNFEKCVTFQMSDEAKTRFTIPVTRVVQLPNMPTQSPAPPPPPKPTGTK